MEVHIGVSDLDRSKAFYDKARKAIGIERLYSEGAEFFGYGAHKKAFFWIGLKPSAITDVHVASQQRRARLTSLSSTGSGLVALGTNASMANLISTPRRLIRRCG